MLWCPWATLVSLQSDLNTANRVAFQKASHIPPLLKPPNPPVAACSAWSKTQIADSRLLHHFSEQVTQMYIHV